jgi:putative transposase
MRAAGLCGYVKRRKGKTTVSVPGVRVAGDLVERDFNPPAPNRLWASDIKYVATWEGTVYLASVIDRCSRRVVGWAMRDQRLRKAGIAQSMGSKGDCYDNAVCESFQATLEKELLRRHSRLGYRSPAKYERLHHERSDCATGSDETILMQERARAA